MKISIITASLNRKEFIGAAIESVLAQNYPDFEHWIIDGGSTDGTLECLQQYPHLKVLSEPDLGVYDAWNKGIGRAKGDFVAILNSDDVYAPGAFENCAKPVAAICSLPVALQIIDSRFFRRSLFDQLGRFDLTYAVASDRDFLIRASLAGIKDVSS